MNAPALANVSSATASPYNVVIVSGKLLALRKYTSDDGPRFAHRVALPMVDEFSKPSTIEFSATEKLGEVGTVIRQKASLEGWIRRFRNKDGEKDERAELRLVAIEA